MYMKMVFYGLGKHGKVVVGLTSRQRFYKECCESEIKTKTNCKPAFPGKKQK